MNTISVHISGHAGVGKSTIAQALARTLQNQYGIDVTVLDDDISSNDWDHVRIESSLEAMADKTNVVIVTQQTRRAGIAG